MYLSFALDLASEEFEAQVYQSDEEESRDRDASPLFESDQSESEEGESVTGCVSMVEGEGRDVSVLEGEGRDGGGDSESVSLPAVAMDKVREDIEKGNAVKKQVGEYSKSVC